MTLTFLGTGTSHGIPVIACNCDVCRSTDFRDKRLRCSVVIRSEKGTNILIDCPPDFRTQALRDSITHIDAVLLTHSHADHLHGLDDLRIFTNEESLAIYSNQETIRNMMNRFSYVFMQTQEGGGKPHFAPIVVDKPIRINEITAIPVPIFHGELPVCGWRINNTAYLTDCSFIPEESYRLLQGLDIVIIDALRWREHVTHLNFAQALKIIAQLHPRQAYFTHICHDGSHRAICEWIAQEQAISPEIRNIVIAPAYDTLKIDLT